MDFWVLFVTEAIYVKSLHEEHSVSRNEVYCFSNLLRYDLVCFSDPVSWNSKIHSKMSNHIGTLSAVMIKSYPPPRPFLDQKLSFLTELCLPNHTLINLEIYVKVLKLYQLSRVAEDLFFFLNKSSKVFELLFIGIEDGRSKISVNKKLNLNGRLVILIPISFNYRCLHMQVEDLMPS
ncbi:Uncharacterized protein TCM_005532 [Theobroma cacao]|uniref:Uncharacterized protein n=1 Tax=Theobroma cacao TaxID=3641 RepID=A0A061DW18_THECC|nr:Uncharacterized protein TCM_005532 [Theobroma cacao]